MALRDPGAGAPSSRGMVLPAGAQVGHLRIEQVMHEGATSIVYRAVDTMAEDAAASPPVALMEFFPRLRVRREADGSVRPRRGEDEALIERGRRAYVADADALRRAADASLVRVQGTLAAHGTVYRAMDFVEGPTLDRLVRWRSVVPSAAQLAALVDRLLDALGALHAAGVTHGHVCAEQILLRDGRFDQPVLLGMGSAAAALGVRLPVRGAGEPPAGAVDVEGDLHALAQTAWFVATGVTPPTLRQQLAWPAHWDPGAGLSSALGSPEAPEAQALQRALVAMLDVHAPQRPGSAAALRQLLHAGGSAPTLPAEPAPGADAAPTVEPSAAGAGAEAAPRPVDQARQRRLRSLVAAVWLVSAALLASAWLWRGSPFAPALKAPDGFLSVEPAPPPALPSATPELRIAPLAQCLDRDPATELRCLQALCRRAEHRDAAECRQLPSTPR
jgi:hypothetical protein